MKAVVKEEISRKVHETGGLKAFAVRSSLTESRHDSERWKSNVVIGSSWQFGGEELPAECSAGQSYARGPGPPGVFPRLSYVFPLP
jgi:hypothetical protein